MRCNGDSSATGRDAGALAARWAALRGTKLWGCKLLGHPCGGRASFLFGSVFSDGVQPGRPPAGEASLRWQRVNLSRADSMVNVYDKHWVSLGHFTKTSAGILDTRTRLTGSGLKHDAPC